MSRGIPQPEKGRNHQQCRCQGNAQREQPLAKSRNRFHFVWKFARRCHAVFMKLCALSARRMWLECVYSRVAFFGFAATVDFFSSAFGSGAFCSSGFSPQMYCANHFSFSSITARCCLGFVIPWPNPLYTTIFTRTPRSSSACRSSYAFGIGTRRSFSPC